jgi:hypothetical protein
MFFMNADNLGGFSTQTNNVLGTYGVGGCWCGASYFVDKDKAARVVSSGGKSIQVWKLATSPNPSLTKVTSSAAFNPVYSGFFTSVSSNHTANPIIWALTRPTEAQTAVSLYAFSPDNGGTTMKQLFAGTAGAWPVNGTNTNLVPVVANGEVFVASYKELMIFGLKAKGKTKK